MKKPALVVSFLTVLSLSSAFAGEGKHLFILSGQSNMVGLKEEKSFTPAVEKEFGKDSVTVVKDALGGRPIRKWVKNWKSADGKDFDAKNEPNGSLYDRLMEKVKKASEGQTYDTVTFVWMQGERDAREKHGEVYAESFKTLISQLEADLKRDDINFVIGRISDFDMENKKYPHWTMVREEQVKLAESDPRGAWVDTDDMNGKNDGLHYSGAGYTELGKRFAEEAISLIKKSEQ